MRLHTVAGDAEALHDEQVVANGQQQTQAPPAPSVSRAANAGPCSAFTNLGKSAIPSLMHKQCQVGQQTGHATGRERPLLDQFEDGLEFRRAGLAQQFVDGGLGGAGEDGAVAHPLHAQFVLF